MTKKPLRPTFVTALGILLGGGLGAGFGVVAGTESSVVAGYLFGNLIGAMVGSWIGWRWHKKRHPGTDSFLLTYWPALHDFNKKPKSNSSKARTAQDGDL